MHPLEAPTKIYNSRTGEERTIPFARAAEQCRQDRKWSFEPPAPAGWEFDTPKYRATRDLQPAPLARSRHELPWTSAASIDTWQFAERPIEAGEEIETDRWPHESFAPLNFAAKQVHKFFLTSQRSRMPLSPVHDGKVRLADGFEGLSRPPTFSKPKMKTITTPAA